MFAAAGTGKRIVSRSFSNVEDYQVDGLTRLTARSFDKSFSCATVSVDPNTDQKEQYPVRDARGTSPMTARQPPGEKGAKACTTSKPEFFVFENVLGLLSAKEEDGTLHFDNMHSLLYLSCIFDAFFDSHLFIMGLPVRKSTIFLISSIPVPAQLGRGFSFQLPKETVEAFKKMPC